MKTATEDKLVRDGHIMMKAGNFHQSFLVYDWEGLGLYYYLGDAACTADGWVSLSRGLLDHVCWENYYGGEISK